MEEIYHGPERREGERRSVPERRAGAPSEINASIRAVPSRGEAHAARRRISDRRAQDRRSMGKNIGKGLAASALLAGGVSLARHNPLPHSPPHFSQDALSSDPPPLAPTPFKALGPDLRLQAYKVSSFLQHYTHSQTADSVAAALVYEAQHRNLSPALLIGILLTEDSNLDPRATSSVGARGLMQVMPMHAGKWGCDSPDLFDIAANVCHGTAILAQLTHEKSNMRSALQAYNGCVHGTNTPNCYTYSHKVYSYASRAADAIGESLPIPPALPIPSTFRHKALRRAGSSARLARASSRSRNSAG